MKRNKNEILYLKCKKLDIKNVPNLVKKHFMDLRSDVQLAAEEVIQQS